MIVNKKSNSEESSKIKQKYVDSSVFNFKSNKYPLGIVMANARRIGKLLSK